MIIAGFQKMTLIDFPGKIATTVFVQGCNFRCHFCHNPALIHGQNNSVISEEDFFLFLKKRKGLLDGVCITGGEPTIYSDLFDFIEKIRSFGFFVKLDSNGTDPSVLEEVINRKIVDYIAMDIKHCIHKYAEAIGTNVDANDIRKSIQLLLQERVDYEFRTTVVPGIHTYDDFEIIAQEIRGAKRYFLQKYRESKVLNPEYLHKISRKPLDLYLIKKSIQSNFGTVGIR